jgi:hypothetical protein
LPKQANATDGTIEITEHAKIRGGCSAARSAHTTTDRKVFIDTKAARKKGYPIVSPARPDGNKYSRQLRVSPR